MRQGSGALLFVLWINHGAEWMTLGSSPGFDPRNNGVPDWGMVIISIIGAALVLPLMQELFWRSFLMRSMDPPDFLKVNPGQVKMTSVIVAVILFGVEHNLWLAGIVAGVVYSIWYMRSGARWSAVIAHGITKVCWVSG